MRRRNGFTLIETAVAIALLSLVLLWSVNAYANISKGSKSVEDISIASTLASNQIEYLKTLNYAGLQSISNSTSVVPFDSPNDNYGYKYTNVSVTENANYYLKALTVNIYRIDNNVLLLQMDCNFLRTKSDGKNIGL